MRLPLFALATLCLALYAACGAPGSPAPGDQEGRADDAADPWGPQTWDCRDTPETRDDGSRYMRFYRCPNAAPRGH